MFDAIIKQLAAVTAAAGKTKSAVEDAAKGATAAVPEIKAAGAAAAAAAQQFQAAAAALGTDGQNGDGESDRPWWSEEKPNEWWGTANPEAPPGWWGKP